MDIDLDSVEGRELALADNATAKANIIFDVEVMTAVLEDAVVEEWGINIGSYDRSFTPNLMPGSSNNQVTQDDIDKKTSDLQGHFQQPGRGKMTVTCPHCAEDFEIDVV